jgi:hypothetical protein
MSLRDDDGRPNLVEADRLRGVTAGGPDPADAGSPGHGPTRPVEAGPGTPAEVGRGTAEDDASDDRNLTPGDHDYVPVRDRRPGGDRADNRGGPGQREHEEPRPGFAAEGRHPPRDAGSADRVVGKRRSGSSEGRAGRDQPDREPPLRDYNRLTIPEILDRIRSLSTDELQALREYERAHRRRKTLLVRLERQLRNAGDGPPRPEPEARREPGP